MKKMFFTIAMALLSVGAFAQTYKNEAKINILNVIVRPSIELGYEYYLDENQSVDAELMFLDRFSYWHIWSFWNVSRNGNDSYWSPQIDRWQFFPG